MNLFSIIHHHRVPGRSLAGRVSVVDKDLLAPGDALEAPDPEAGQPKHQMKEPGEGAVRPETVISLVSQRGRVVPGVSEPEKNKLEKINLEENKSSYFRVKL